MRIITSECVSMERIITAKHNLIFGDLVTNLQAIYKVKLLNALADKVYAIHIERERLFIGRPGR